MRLALTEPGTTSDSEYGAYGMRFVRAINITGLGPEEVVGTMTTDPDKWSIRELAVFSPFRPDLPDTMTPRLRPGPSKIRRAEVLQDQREQPAEMRSRRRCVDRPDGVA